MTWMPLARWSRTRRLWALRPLVRVLALVAAVFTLRCDDTLDICAPTESRLGFFSKGDCIVTRASFFQGHEWLTWFGNRDLPEADRFTEQEVHDIAEGNRRVDWPAELLLHLNNSVVAYALALTEYTDRPEHQRFHFLLSDRNDSVEARREALDELSKLTEQAVGMWSSNRVRALTLVGRACHLIQDSFSEAHAVREASHPEKPWCVRSLKAYIERADGFESPDIQYHGADDDESIGHTTPEDSLYRPGRDCHEPASAREVEACLSEAAERARLATRDYLALIRRVLRTSNDAENPDVLVATELANFVSSHLDFCP